MRACCDTSDPSAHQAASNCSDWRPDGAARSQQSLSHSCHTDTPGSPTTETLWYVAAFHEERDAAYGSHDSRAERGILADDAETRRGISGGLLTLFGVLLGSLVRTQTTTALSSCEAELHAIGSGCAERLGLHMLLIETEVRIATRSWPYEAHAVCVCRQFKIGHNNGFCQWASSRPMRTPATARRSRCLLTDSSARF